MPVQMFALSEEDYAGLVSEIRQLKEEVTRLKQVVKATATQTEAEKITGMGYAALKTERERPGTCIRFEKGQGKNGHIIYDRLSLIEFKDARQVKPYEPLKLTA